MELQPGSRLKSQVCNAEFIVVKSPAGPVALCCGGQPMISAGRAGPGSSGADNLPIRNDLAGGTLLGKRYEAADLGLELLCTRAGLGTLTIDECPLVVRAPSTLPSSD